MPVGHVIVCGRVPLGPFAYFIRSTAFATRWKSEVPHDDRSWHGRVLTVRLRGEASSDLDASMRTNLESLAQRNAGFVIWIDGAEDDREGWKVVKELAHEIALDTEGALLSLRDRAVLDAPPVEEVDVANESALDTLAAIDRAVFGLKHGDAAPLAMLVDIVLVDASNGWRRTAAIVAHELLGPVSGNAGDAFTGPTLRSAAEQLARIARALDSGRNSALYPALARAQDRLGDEPSSVVADALADRERHSRVLDAMAWAEQNPPSRSDVTWMCRAACEGDLESIEQIHAWALRFPADPPAPLSRAEMGERLAFVGPFCAAVRAASTLHPQIWSLANAVMGSKLVESGGTLAALRAKLPKESGA